MKTLRLLLVEDSEDDALLVLRELRRNGYQVAHQRVQSAEEFIEALDSTWDVVLADYSMPGFSGAQALEILRRHERHEPFVFVSGTIGEERAVEAMRTGAQDYVLKGNLRRLAPVIERSIRESESRQRAAELREQLIQAQRLEAVGRLASGIAHDFNNLLTIIIGVGEMLAEDPELSPSAQRGISEVREAAERAAVLTRRLLAFSRKQVVDRTVFDLNELVAGIERILRRLIGEDIVLECRLAPDPAPIFADRGQMEQVLLNLVVNARDALPSGGAISIETANVVEAAEPATGGRWVQLTVRDDGTGMSDPVRQRIFEPLFTTKEMGRGTGLGLATCKAIVDESGGRIEVDSALGEGTTVRVLVPETTRERERQRRDPSADPTGDETILLVEDDVAVRAVLARGLGAIGYRVIQEGGVEGALELLETGEVTPDLLVTDVVLPDGNGPQLAERASVLRPDLEVLFISGYAEEELLRNRIARGVAVIQKPVTPLDLAKRIRQLLDGS